MIGAAVPQLQLTLGLSRPEFAKLLGINERTLRRWEAHGLTAGASAAFVTVLYEKTRDPQAAQILAALAASAVRETGLSYFVGRLMDVLVMAERLQLPLR